MSLIVSPKTGKLIKVGSEAFSELLEDPKYKDFLLNPEAQELPKAKVKTSGSPPLTTLPPIPTSPLPSPKFSLPPLPSSSTPKMTLPPLPSSPKRIYSPPSPSGSLKDIPMPLTKELPTIATEEVNNPVKIPYDSHLDEILKMPFASIPTLEETLRKTTQPAKREKLKQMIADQKYEERRGIKTRGWIGRSPQRGRERHELKAMCGDRCFLLPEEEKFPICAAPKFGQGCSIDCTGIQSAYIRAAQWKYPEVEEKAKILLEKCNKGGLKRFLPTPPSSPMA